MSAFNAHNYLSIQLSSLLLKVEMVAADTRSSVEFQPLIDSLACSNSTPTNGSLFPGRWPM